MCIIFAAVQQHPDYPLIIAANRDEFYARPTAPSSFWHTHPDMLAGKDLSGGGTHRAQALLLLSDVQPVSNSA